MLEPPVFPIASGGPLGSNFQVSFPKQLFLIRCLVEGCLGGVSNWTNLRVYFAHHHVRDKIVILEEGNQPYPRCPKCDIFVSYKALNGRHLATDFYHRGEERRWRRLEEEEARAGTAAVVTTYGIPLAPVASFKYLGRVLLVSDEK